MVQESDSTIQVSAVSCTEISSSAPEDIEENSQKTVTESEYYSTIGAG